MNLQMNPHQIDQETEDPQKDHLEEMIIMEMVLKVHQVEDHQEEDSLDPQVETLKEDPLDEMDMMAEEVDLDLQVGMVMMDKMVILDEMEEVHMDTLDMDMLYQLKLQLQQQQEM